MVNLFKKLPQHAHPEHSPAEHEVDANVRTGSKLTPPPHVFNEQDFAAIASSRVNNCDIRVLDDPSKGKILWLLGGGDNTKRIKYILGRLERTDPLLPKRVVFVPCNTISSKILIPKPKTKATQMVRPDYKEVLANHLGPRINSASVVVINDFSVCAALLADSTGHGTKKTLAAFRGSTYVNDLFHGVPALVIEDASKCYVPTFASPTGKHENTKAQNVQFFDYDLQKLSRLFADPTRAKSNFDETFNIVNGAHVSHYTGVSGTRSYNTAQSNPLTPWYNAQEYMEWLGRQTLLAIDTELSLGYITTFTVTGIENNDPATIKTWAIPYVNPTTPTNEHMTFVAWYTLFQATLHTQTPKIWHNGNFDLAHAIRYNLPPNGINHDSMLAWHALNPQMPQSLAAVSSIFNDDYYFWKDEIKGGSDEKKANTKYAVPTSRNGLLTYLRYAGLDTHHTMQAFLSLMANVGSSPQALYNYAKEYALARGPLLSTNLRGINVDSKEFNRLIKKEREATKAGLLALREASNGIVNSGTDAECIQWLYKTLGAPTPPAKAGRKNPLSVDQKQLILVAEKHPIFARAIEVIRGHREHKKRVDMYSPPNADKAGGLKLTPLPEGRTRFRHSYSLKPYTGRLACSGSAYFDGTNSQNIPAKMRSFLRADAGKVLIDIDYSQADLYHFAIACGDEAMIKTIFDDRDTHAVHVEMILQVPYDEVMAGKRSNDPFVVDPIKGVRQIIKKLSHGGNYGMSPPTAYVNAGRESLEAAAGYLGKANAKWTRSNYYDFCEELLVPYFDAYARQKIWRRELVKECVANEGYMTCFGGLTVYFDDWKRPKDHSTLMRALLAFYGQGGTAGMINQAMLDMHYRSDTAGNIRALGWEESGAAKSYGNTTHAHRYTGETVYQAGTPSDPRTSFLAGNNIELLLQTHDSLTYQTPVTALLEKNIVNKLLTAMELQCNFNGRDYVVPCEVNIGHRWSKAMPEIKRDATDTQLVMALLANYKEEGLLNV